MINSANNLRTIPLQLALQASRQAENAPCAAKREAVRVASSPEVAGSYGIDFFDPTAVQGVVRSLLLKSRAEGDCRQDWPGSSRQMKYEEVNFFRGVAS